MPITLNSKDALITVARTAQKPIAFLVGSPLSTDSGGGVPGVTPMLDLAREEIRQRASSELPRFEDVIRGKAGGDAYQAAMQWLQVNLSQDGVNRVVRGAVLLARKLGAVADFDSDGEARDWHIPAGTQQLASLVCADRHRCPGPILTTNFDPLLSLAIETYGGRPHLRVIQSDGGLGHDVTRTGEIEIVHLHGFWRDSDTLHTPAQLTAPRPRLKDSLKEILRQRTLIVAAYAGWDDVFASALAEVAVDDAAQVNVFWCFRDSDAAAVEHNYRLLLKRVENAIIRGRFIAYGGIDCHSIFGEIAAALAVTGSAPIGGPGAGFPPIAGWEILDPAVLGALPPLSREEAIRYFDGAVPTWRHAVSDAIPRRQDAAELGARLAGVQSERSACSLQLIRAAGGEGKSTLLLQAAADAAGTGGWTVLWRASALEGLPPNQVAHLDPSQQWLIVVDGAENIVGDLADSAKQLHERGQTNVHFLLAARDADWRNANGDRQPWEEWLKRQRDLILRGITHDDAEAVVQAWGRYGADGLRELATHGNAASQAAALEHAVCDAANAQGRQKQQRRVVDGSFFGGLLAVRFGQDGLRSHVRAFLDRLEHIDIAGGNGSLLEGLVYVAACHGAAIPGIDERVLADLLGVPRDWVQSRVVRPLGEEAAAVHSAGHVFTRHSKVAAAILVEAEQAIGIDVAEVWARLVRQTVRNGPDIRMDRSWFSRVAHAGPRLQLALPPQLSEDRRKAIAIAAATASSEAEPSRLSYVIDLGRTYRAARMIAEAVATFRDNMNSDDRRVDHDDAIRGYWYEWGVCEGLAGDNAYHRAADAWVQGLSLSDHLNPAPISNEDGKLSCAGLGVAFGKLAKPGPACPYAKARRAVAFLGRLTNPDPKTASYFSRHDRDADKLKTAHPKDLAEAIAWLTAGVAAAGAQLQDPFLRTLTDSTGVSFRHFETALTKPKGRASKRGA